MGLVSGQYGKIVYECAKYFLSQKAREIQHSTRVQYLTILITNPCNERFNIHFFHRSCLSTIDQTQLHYSVNFPSILSGCYTSVHIMSASLSHCFMRRLFYSCIVYIAYKTLQLWVREASRLESEW